MQQTHKTLFSDSWQIIKPDLIKVLKGFIIAVLGGIATYLETGLLTDMNNLLLSELPIQYIPLAIGMIAAINSSIINFLYKLIGKNTYIDKK